ncbi:hypothetical protein LC040_02865 [Bacillus tianshenii]|nr:hypothetical protein LC040_02865 [Bacillus tianshenii]
MIKVKAIENLKRNKSKVDKVLSNLWRISLLVGLFVSILHESYFAINQAFIIQYSLLTANIIIAFIILFRRGFGFERFGYFLLTGVLVGIMYGGFLDVKDYLQGDFTVIKGIPSELKATNISNGPDYYYVQIKNESFQLPMKGIERNMKNDCFVIKYLPHSKYIIDYKVLSSKECSNY